MNSRRIIPCLLLHRRGLYKTVKFQKPKYVGDPINAIRIFNEKECDELIFLDIDAGITGKGPDFQMLEKVSSECFMPLCYGGGLKTLFEIERVLKVGVEKVAICNSLIENPNFVKEAARRYGSSTIVGAIDFKRTMFGKPVGWCRNTRKQIGNLTELAKIAEELGVGELLLNSIERDGSMDGYDLEAIKAVTATVQIPVIACGGAGSLVHFRDAFSVGGASAVAAGSYFVFHGKHRAVLITYPSKAELAAAGVS